jgi:SAM-dependent methyltransferase
VSETEHLERQRAFYEERAHDHLRPQDQDLYASKLTDRLVEAAGIRPHHHVVEIGASFGRFTFRLLEHCHKVTAVDLSERALGELDRARTERGIEASRCRPLHADASSLSRSQVEEPVDFVIGLFILHHLADVPAALRSAAELLRPGGGVAFVEPNRRNPLFLAQVACCPDMTWREEQGMFRLSAAGVRRGSRAAGLDEFRSSTFGFFPPQVLNRFGWAPSLEGRLESLRVLRGVLPFLLMTAHKPAPAGAAKSP